MSITILWKVLNLPTPSNIPQVLRSHWAKSFILSPAMAPSAKKRENIVLQFWIVSSILVLSWLNYVWPKLYLREQKPSSAERNHFFWGFADSWVSSESEQCISLLQKHLKSFCLWSISISAARELGMTNHPQIKYFGCMTLWYLFFSFLSFLSFFDSLLSHTQKLSQNQVVQISSNKYRLKVLRVCWTQSCDWILLSNLSASRLWLNDFTEDQFSMMHNEICWTTVIICL